MAICVNYEKGMLEVCEDCAPSVLEQFAGYMRCGDLDDVASTCPTARCVCHGEDCVTSALLMRIATNSLLLLHVPKVPLTTPMLVRFKEGSLSVCVECTHRVLLQFARSLTCGLGDVIAMCPTKSCGTCDTKATTEQLVVHVFRSAYTTTSTPSTVTDNLVATGDMRSASDS